MPDEFDDGSSHHHYIPVYYTKGWTDANGFLAVYDKLHRRLLRKRLSPKGLFYELGGNSAHTAGRRNTIAERVFREVDTRMAPILARIRKDGTGKMPASEVNAMMMMMAVNQHFRVPANDALYDLIFKGSELIVKDTSGNRMPNAEETLRLDATHRKAMRAVLPSQLLTTTLEGLLDQPTNHEGRILTASYPLFVLSDNPVVYPKRLARASDMLKSFMYPVDATHLYAQHTLVNAGRGLSVSLNYNALAIDQADRWFCAPNATILEESVKYWLKLRSIGWLPARREELFRDSFEVGATRERST